MRWTLLFALLLQSPDALLIRRQITDQVDLRVEMANGSTFARMDVLAPGCAFLDALVALDDAIPSAPPACMYPGCGPVHCDPAYDQGLLTLYVPLPPGPALNVSVYVLLHCLGQVGRVYARAPAAVSTVHCLEVCY